MKLKSIIDNIIFKSFNVGDCLRLNGYSFIYKIVNKKEVWPQHFSVIALQEDGSPYFHNPVEYDGITSSMIQNYGGEKLKQ
jgi:hypothetical protein